MIIGNVRIEFTELLNSYRNVFNFDCNALKAIVFSFNEIKKEEDKHKFLNQLRILLERIEGFSVQIYHRGIIPHPKDQNKFTTGAPFCRQIDSIVYESKSIAILFTFFQGVVLIEDFKIGNLRNPLYHEFPLSFLSSEEATRLKQDI